MSLYVGHLSPHVRREELERIFRRFGQCNLQMKNGYGFVIYEVTAHAERALRSLRGKNICGEQISLSWSNRQPRPLQRSARSTRFYEPYRGKHFREGDNGVGIRGSRRNFCIGASLLPSTNHNGYHLDDAPEKQACRTSDDFDDHGEEKGRNAKERVLDESDAIEPYPVEIDRWGEPASDTLVGDGMENGAEFDRYEPYHGYKGRDESSPDHENSLEKGRRGESTDEIDRHLNILKRQPACYHCGLVGHIARNCPEVDVRREKFGKFNHRRDDINSKNRGDGRLKRPRLNSWGRPNSTRDHLISKRPVWDRREPHSGKVRRVIKSESSSERKVKHQSKLRRESQKRVSKQDRGNTKKTLTRRKAKRSRTSQLSSDSSTTSSHSEPKSSRSSSGTSSHSISRSACSHSRSASASSKSASASSYSKSLSSRSRSRSRSSSPRSRSLSVSLDHKQPASPEDVHTDAPASTFPKGNLEHASSPKSDNHLLAILESSEPKGTCSALKVENAFISSKVNVDNSDEHPGHGGDAGQGSAYGVTHKETNSFNDPLEDIALISGKFAENCGDMSEQLEGASVESNMPGGSSTKITPQELVLALRHYGLLAPDEVKSGMSVEEYFGAARSWPWEMIYYRRLKKGPITNENYARRLEQNKEFGIVDKYIRSSSGWGELN